VLTTSMFNLAMWMFWAVLTILGFVSSLKRTTERLTERYCVRRRRRRARREREKVHAQERRAPAAPTPQPAPAALETAAVCSLAAGWRPVPA
jgi:hypothetical protein